MRYLLLMLSVISCGSVGDPVEYIPEMRVICVDLAGEVVVDREKAVTAIFKSTDHEKYSMCSVEFKGSKK